MFRPITAWIHESTASRSDAVRPSSSFASLSTVDAMWTLGGFCVLHRKPLDPELLVKQFSSRYTTYALIHPARAFGSRIKRWEDRP